MNLVLILLMALLALGAATSTNHRAPSVAAVTVLDTTAAPVVAPMATATDAPTPAPYDVINGGGPSH